ncbi:4'-phosphopantetheinyl transferase family protein [Herbidospora sp. RD11066]
MIEQILPPFVKAADTVDDRLGAPLFPEEEAVIAAAVDKRRREFTTARACARLAMRKLDRPPAPILPGVRGEPLWPGDLVGSITHCAGYRGAVVGLNSTVASIGIDAEPAEPLPPGVLEAVGLPEERRRIHALCRSHPSVPWDRLLFCAKESVYKAWYPLANAWLNFEDAIIHFDPARGTFDARLLVTGPRVNGRRITGFSGRWLASEGLILTAIVVPLAEPAEPGVN